MKLFKNFSKYLCCLAIAAGSGMISSCNYLDVVPPEQADLSDATKDKESTLGFLFSCYGGINNTCPFSYSGFTSSTDEFVLPPLWANDGASSSIAYGLNTPLNVQDGWLWGNTCYRFIGQCYLFEKELPGAREVTEDEKAQWKAEADFLIAYYHMVALLSYGPIPITEGYIDMNADNSEFPGRSHFDYCVDWISKKFDEVALALPTTRSGEDYGRATSVMAKALKARLLLYAASPLWNGSFPYPEWKNTNYETPGYGKELVSHTYDPEKWTKAKAACEEALSLAESNGYKLMDLSDVESLITQQSIALPYVPFKNVGGSSEAAETEFKKRVLLMRYITTTRYTEGNREMIFPISTEGDFIAGSMPHRIIKDNSGKWRDWYSGVSPTLNTVESFYTENGKLPAKDPNFYPESQWFESAGATGSDLRANIIKLNARREPRFYAWMAFDGGDYGSKAMNGQPIPLELRNSQLHGYDPDTYTRDNCTTGYLNQKFVEPNYNVQAGSITHEGKPKAIMRMAELYLNLAECDAATGDVDGAIKNLNIIRKRAGVPELTKADITSDMTITDWVQTERDIELWGEGHRYYDVRRWMIAPEKLGAGVRMGLNAIAKKDPSFEEFNKPTVVNQPFKWLNRMYLLPVFYNEVYKNPQMVQAPGY